jgi:hypothetical protein
MTNHIQFGTRVRDRITGFEGIATAHCDYISGCNQTLVTPPVKDGKFEAGQWFDDQRIEVLNKGAVEVRLDNAATPGAGDPAPVR